MDPSWLSDHQEGEKKRQSAEYLVTKTPYQGGENSWNKAVMAGVSAVC